MLAALKPLLDAAQSEGYAIGAFNVYNLEGVRAVIRAAEHARSPVMLQLHPSAHQYGGSPLVALCLEAAVVRPLPWRYIWIIAARKRTSATPWPSA